jgi:hypothetical protein
LSLLLRREGENVGRYKAGRLMKEAGLVSRQPGKHRYRLCNRQSNLAENHLSRNFTVNAPDNVWWEISLLSEHKRAGCIWQWYWIYTREKWWVVLVCG